MKNCLKVISRNNHEKEPSETSWCTLLIPANLVAGREHRHALKPVVVPVTTCPRQQPRSSMVIKKAWLSLWYLPPLLPSYPHRRNWAYTETMFRLAPSEHQEKTCLVFPSLRLLTPLYILLTMSLAVESCSAARSPNGTSWRCA